MNLGIQGKVALVLASSRGLGQARWPYLWRERVSTLL